MIHKPDQKIAVVGYGLLGRPIAMCLRDSGLQVRIGMRRDSENTQKAKDDKFDAGLVEDVATWANVVFLLIPDDQQGEVYSESLDSTMQDGSILILAHGYSFLYSKIIPKENIDAVVLAPHGPGNALRESFLEGSGLAAQIAVHQDASGQALSRTLEIARFLGHDKGGIRICSVREEVVMDHFAEQMVLCGGVVELMRAAYKTLVDGGYDPESAYESIVKELQYTVDLIHEYGPGGMLKHISKSALAGSLWYGKAAVGEDVLKRMRDMLEKIEDGEFKSKFEKLSQADSEDILSEKLKEIEDDFRR
ncbi:ketol-acid reductoisomerase [bacterium]|nr:ketol-acid reductoisomerase [bacterium]MBU1025986.1 ketol-acid reductoisomerase [bacterium]